MSTTLHHELKSLIIEACDKAVAPDEISDTEPLFGPEAPLQLDSLDALQVSMALKKKYGLRLLDSKETRRILSNVASLAEHLVAWQARNAG
jgi:acyl carrier protein